MGIREKGKNHFLRHLFQRRFKCLTFLLFLIVLMSSVSSITGCATSRSAEAIRVQEADNAMVANCIFLGEVEAKSGWGGIFGASTGRENAKNEALEKAVQLGATHVVWTDVGGFFVPSATGRAYRCK